MKYCCRSVWRLSVAAIACAVLLATAGDASAARARKAPAAPAPAKRPAQKAAPRKAPAPVRKNYRPAKPAPKPEPRPESSTICIEADSGLVLSEENADFPRPPASMIKMMMLLLVSEGVRDRKWNLETPVTVTKHSQGMGGTQVFLKEGEVFPLKQLMLAVAVASANDAAMAVAEGLWGSEDAYKKRMNERARELGMTNSQFNSVHGLPPARGQEPDRTTARDMSKLAQVLVKDPLVLSWTSVKEFVFRPGETAHQNTNKLLSQMPDCDGLKTGFINMAGFCITATAKRNDMRLITVVMGFDQKQDRFNVARQLLETGFAETCKYRVLAKGDPIEPAVTVTNCETPDVKLTAANDLYVIVKSSDKDKISIVPELPPAVKTPLTAGTAVGTARAELAGKTLAKVTLIAPVDLREARWHWKLLHAVY